MRKILYPVYFILISLLIGCQKSERSQVPNFDWLLGTWQTSTSRGLVYETWSKASAKEYQGNAFRISNGDTVILESIEIIFDKKRWYYIPTVPDQNDGLPIRFEATRITDSEMLFENPEHDSPNAVLYRKAGEDAIIAEIWTINDGEKKVVEFPMKRME